MYSTIRRGDGSVRPVPGWSGSGASKTTHEST